MGEEGSLCDPGLSYYWEGEREKCEDKKWDEERNKKKNCFTYPRPRFRLFGHAFCLFVAQFRSRS